eukprot:Em0006g177a
MSTHQVGRPPKVIHPAKEGRANKLLKYIDTISPLPLNALGDPPTNHCFIADDNLSVLQQLKCPLCLEVVKQPLELPCKALVCAKCIRQWIVVSADVQCPCCYDTAPLLLNPAPTLVLNILGDVLVHCAVCSRDIRAKSFDDHQCTPSPTEEEVIAAAGVLRRRSSTSPENPVLKCPTGGRPVTFMRVTATHNVTKSASKRTLKRRCQEMSHVRDIVSGGEASTLLENEIKWMSDDEKHHLLVESGIAMDIKVSAEQGLAIKAGLAIPWHKLRHLRRWLKASGISIGCEERMRQISREMIRGNLKGEIAPFSFSLKSGGEEIRGAALFYVPNLVEKVFQLLDENAK